MKTLYENDEIFVAETSEMLQDATSAVRRIEKLDWQQIAKELNEQGSANAQGRANSRGVWSACRFVPE